MNPARPDCAFSVVIPAHNEAAVIERCLRSFLDGAHPGEVEVIVVCNGCTDDTADRARAVVGPKAVIELATPGKIAALNAGDAHTSVFPRIYLDADIEVTIEVLRAVASTLRGGSVACAAPKPAFELRGRPWAIRAFYRIWEFLPYLNDEIVGSGLYALSEAGRRRFDQFPDLTGDDQFVMQQFDRAERTCIRSVSFTIHPPTRLRGLVAMRRRVYRGNRELAQSGLTRHGPPGGRGRGLVRIARSRPSLLPALFVYVGVNTYATLRARTAGHDRWERDDSARGLGPPSSSPAPAVKVGYLTSRYPSVSHTFVLREVAAARRAGLDVSTFCIRRAEPEDLLSAADEAEAARTWAIRPVGAVGVVLPHLRALLRHRRAWVGTLGFSIRQSPPGIRAHLWQVFYFLQAVMLWRECQRRGIHHLHAHLANVAADVAWLAAEFGRRADPTSGWCWSLSIHGPTEFAAVEASNLPAKFRSAARILCITDFTKSQVMAASQPEDWAKLRIVHMGVDLARYPFTPERPCDPDGALRVLNVGRLHPAKGQAVLLQAVAQLHEAGIPIRVTMVGDGPLAATLRAEVGRLRLEQVVELPGAVGQDALPALYARSDVFCLSSFAEGLPVVLMEAMASGLPVVSTRINGIPELVVDGVTGLLVPPARADLLAAALRRLYEDGDLRARLTVAGRRAVESDFDAERCGRAAAAYLAELHGSAPDLPLRGET